MDQIRARFLEDNFCFNFLFLFRLNLSDELGEGEGGDTKQNVNLELGTQGIHVIPESGNHHQPLSHCETQWRYYHFIVLSLK